MYHLVPQRSSGWFLIKGSKARSWDWTRGASMVVWSSDNEISTECKRQIDLEANNREHESEMIYLALACQAHFCVHLSSQILRWDQPRPLLNVKQSALSPLPQLFAGHGKGPRRDLWDLQSAQSESFPYDKVQNLEEMGFQGPAVIGRNKSSQMRSRSYSAVIL